MPFTPFHFGPAILIGAMLGTAVDLPALLLGSVLLDLEPFLVLLFGLPFPLHGFFHTLAGALVAGTTLGLISIRLRPRLARLYTTLRLPLPAMRTIFLSALGGTLLHVLLDAPLYADIQPFWPLAPNYLFGTVSAAAIYAGCMVTGLAGITLTATRTTRPR